MLAQKLRYGDTIGVIAPASPEDSDIIDKKLGELKELGFYIKEGIHLRDRSGYLAGIDKDRASDLMNMFISEDVDAILCFRGGYGTMRMLPYINFDIIKKHPKVFVGYSDITAILNTLYQRCDLITFHGPMANSDLTDQPTLKSFLEALMNGDKPYSITENQKTNLKYANFKRKISGRLIGGNLSLICSTLKTDYEIDINNKILFIEDVDESPYKIDRMLTQLILSQKLSGCKAIILGQFTGCTLPHYERSYTLDQVIQDRVISLGIPTCYYVDSGHDMPKLTIPIGAKIEIDPINRSISTIEKIVK